MPNTRTDAAQSMMRVEIAKKERSYGFNAQANEKLLFAGLRMGIPLPYECATGTCGSCRAKLQSGQLDPGWLQAPARKNFKAGRREILMCQASAQSPCRLAVPANIRAFRHDDLRPGHYRGVLASCARLAADVLRFEVKLPAPVRFHAGQFFVLRTPAVEGYRAYSMVNYAPQTDCPEFIIKRKPGGRFSDWLFDSDQTHAPLELFGPLGRATFHADEDFDLFLIAGGSGIAGLMCILEHACQLDYLQNHKAALFFGVRTWDDLFFSDRLAAMRARFPGNLDVHLVASEQNPKVSPPAPLQSFSTAHGLVHRVAMKSLPPGAANTMVYLAGPPPMVDAGLRSLIVDAKISPEMIRYDKFS